MARFFSIFLIYIILQLQTVQFEVNQYEDQVSLAKTIYFNQLLLILQEKARIYRSLMSNNCLICDFIEKVFMPQIKPRKSQNYKLNKQSRQKQEIFHPSYQLQRHILQQRTMHPFQVYARVRPLSDKQTDYYCGKKATSTLDNETLAVRDQDYRETLFQLDSIFGEESQNEQIFEEAVRPLVDNFLSGINSTVLAYGITGAGKSFTMFGKNNDYSQRPGLIQLAIEYICQNLAGDEDAQLSLSYMEIYNEQVFDLLRHKSESLQILDDPVVGVIVNDLEQVEIVDTEMALRCIYDGNQRRVVAQTKANQFSSRSHAIVQLNLEKKIGDSVMVAKLSLVDLAGSQKQSVYAQNKGIRNFEGSNINKSLLTLGNCINILSAKKGYVPYRDSKLTRLLKDSLGGNTRTSMIACVSPSLMAIEETINTLKYACRARKIQKNVHQNIRQPRTTQQFKRQIAKLRRQVQLGKAENGKVGISRQEMQEILVKLIKNVESVALLRLQSSNDLCDKMKEVELIDEQRAIINNILSRCQDDSKPEERSIKHSQSEKVFPVKPRYTREQSSIQLNQNNPLQRISEQDMENFHQTATMVKKESATLPRNNSFEVSKLENRRLKYRQIRKNLKDLVFSYHQSYQNEELRLLQVQRALLFLHENPTLSSQEQRHILQKMSGGQRLLESDLSVFHIQQAQPILKQNSLQQASPQKNGNRFMSSLQEIRRMMRKINNNQSQLTQNYYEGQYDDRNLFEEMRIEPLLG